MSLRKRTRSGTLIDRAYRAGGLIGLTAARGLANRFWPGRGTNFKPRAAATTRTGGFTTFASKELKYNDLAHQGVVEATIALGMQDPATGSLTNIEPGTGQTERVGRVVYPKSLMIYGNLDVDTQVSNTTDYYVTFWLVEDKQSNQTQMNPTNFLVATGLSVQADAMQNLEYSDRFKLLKKKQVRISPKAFRSGVGNDAQWSFQIPIRFYCKLPKSSKVQYSGADGAIGSIATHSYHLIAVKSDGAPITNLRYQCRVRYTD